MKITPNTDLSALLSSKNPPQPQKTPDLPKKTTRKTPRKTSRNTPRLSKKSGPPTPLLRWKFHEERENGGVKDNNNNNNNNGDDNDGDAGNVGADEKSPEFRRKSRREKVGPPVSARKLAATLWRMQLVVPENGGEGGGGDGGEQVKKRREKKESEDRLGFKVCFNSLFETQDLNLKPVNGHGGDRLSYHHASRECGSEAKEPLRSPCSVNGPTNGYHCERQSPFRFTNYAMEGATKWDPVHSKETDEHPDDLKSLDQKVNAASMISTLEKELEQARGRIEELEAERRSSKKKLEHFLKKLSEERATWRSREHEKVRAIIDDVKADLSRERKNRQRLEIVNSKLVNEMAEVKLSAKRYMQDYEKERKARELIEEVCDELAKEIGEDKAEVDSLKKECMKIRDEVEEERKMLQMAEVWREERVQMKLVDAKVALDQKYSQMNYLVSELDKFLRSKGVNLDMNEMREAELFTRAAASIDIQDLKEFTYEPSNPDDIFAVVEEMVMAESNVREIEPCAEYSPASHSSKVHAVSPETNNHSKESFQRLSNGYGNQSADMDDDGSGWETVSHAEDQGSSYSPDGSMMSINRMYRDSNASGSCTEWEEQGGDETPITEISEVCSVPSKQLKKVKSITRLWRSGPNSGDNYKIISVDGVNGRLSNGRVSNGATMSPDHGSNKSGISPSAMVDWNSPDINRGMKGCIEWPRGAHKSSLKHKLLEARMESQKVQLRHVLKQKI
ncbi:uncharacterized protein LOC110723838 isoform X1 [Chenopodium quinoa]|uniref:uncharacterized protein LOC110723838 isoform X1 n=1 Tax=Chenopodium quinoa TaxID=63459 RepID=UPI000B790245|nr:uncharacterized protein LOC110723838 isoform X1 [Chenopodium quinoa]